MNEPFDKFESEVWNNTRNHYEANVIEAVYDLSIFMGCNSFTLNSMGKSIIVKVEDEPSDV
jgi:hypothetical protein